MPIHDWSRADNGIFHDFHIVWIGRLKGILNEELLPRPFYALAEPILGEAEPDVIALVADTGYDPAYGARHLQRNIERLLLAPLAAREPGSYQARAVDGHVVWTSAA